MVSQPIYADIVQFGPVYQVDCRTTLVCLELNQPGLFLGPSESCTVNWLPFKRCRLTHAHVRVILIPRITGSGISFIFSLLRLGYHHSLERRQALLSCRLFILKANLIQHCSWLVCIRSWDHCLNDHEIHYAYRLIINASVIEHIRS